MGEQRRRTRLRRGVAVALLAVAAATAVWWARDRRPSAAGFWAGDRDGSPAAYAYSDLHWEFADRPKPWDEPTKAVYTRRCLEIARRHPHDPVAFAALQRALEAG